MSNGWLYSELKKSADVKMTFGEPVFSVTFSGRTEQVFCPGPAEYAVTADVVKTAYEHGATIISYASWCQATYEAKQYGKKLGILVMPHNSFFAYLKRKGVKFPDA